MGILLRAAGALTLSLLTFVLAVPAAQGGAVQDVDLNLLGRTTPPGDENQAEIAAHDPASDRLFVTNGLDNQLDVYDLSDPASIGASIASLELEPFGGSDADDFGPSSVDVHDGLVAVALQGRTPQAIGTVQFFSAAGLRLGEVRVGALPDMLTFTADGSYLLVANEGEPSSDGIVDPEGSVTVIDMRGGLDDLVVRQEGFHGVPLRGPVRIYTPGNDAPRDLEPEYITTQGDTAYVAIQEANAVGILDISSGQFEVVRSLGFKDHGAAGQGLDPSDQDGGENIAPWANVSGMYQPDAIGAYQLSSTTKVRCKRGSKKRRRGKKCRREVLTTYVATANEGDTRAFTFFNEESRVNALTLDPTVFASGQGMNANLGRLNVTKTLGDRDGDGDYERLFVPGGRSSSILDADGRLVFDTGDQLEQLAADDDAANFNKDHSAASATDNRSDNKGPEPEALVVGKVGEHQYSFVGAERSGGIYAFDLTSTPGEAEFAGYINSRPDDLGPEGAAFVPAAQSPTGTPLLLVTYEISSTVAVYELGT